MNKKFAISTLSIFLLLPIISFAQGPILFPGTPPLTSTVDLYTLAVLIASIILNATWVISVAFVIVQFIIAGFKFLSAQGNPQKIDEARHAVIWGTGGIVVILLAFSILVIMRVTLGL